MQYHHHPLSLTPVEEEQIKEIKARTGIGIIGIFRKGIEALQVIPTVQNAHEQIAE